MIYSIKDLSEMLSRKVEEVCEHLLPNGTITEDQWRAGSVGGEEGQSLRIDLTGNHAGKWKDWATEQHGDLIDLWQEVRSTNTRTAIQQIKEWLGIAQELTETRRFRKVADNQQLQPLAIDGKARTYLHNRKLTDDIIDAFHLEGDGTSIVFPSYSVDGEILNRSYLALKRDEKGRKIFRQEKDGAPILFGWQASPNLGRSIIITEGQIDAMTWRQWGHAAVSVPSGAGNMQWIDAEWSNLEIFSEIFLSFDMDDVGQANARIVANRLGLHRCRVIKLPLKDANECLQEDMSKEEADVAIQGATYMQHAGIHSATFYTRDTLDILHPEGGIKKCFTTPWLKGWDGQFEFLPGDVTLWTGISGHGKTTLLTFLMTEAIAQGEGVFKCSLEMAPAKVLANALKMLKKQGYLSKEEITAGLKELEGRLIFADKIGSIRQKDLFEMMQFAWSRYGASQFVIDSLMRVEGLEENFPAQGDFLNGLQSFAKSTGAHVHLVAHPRKGADESRPGKLDIKGSSLIYNNCDNICIIHRNKVKEELRRERPMTKQEDETMYDAELVSDKQRDEGWTGRILLSFDKPTKRFDQWRDTFDDR